jgi:hypothetical protein
MKICSKKINFSLIFWGVFYILIFSLLLRNSFSYLDPDFGWHSQVGAEIIRSGAVPTVNIYNFSFVGNWVDHEWLSNTLLSLINDKFGYIFLSLLFALLIILVLILLNIGAKRRFPALPDWFLAALQFFAVLTSLPHFGVRIQELGLLFLLLLLIIIDSYLINRRFWLLFFLPPLFFLWACLHASFLLGFFLLFLFLLIKLTEIVLHHQPNLPLRLDYSKQLTVRELSILAVFMVFSFLGTLLTPYGPGLYSFLSGYQDRFYLYHVQEWLPQFFFPFQYGQLLYLALVFFCLIFRWYFSWTKKRPLNLWSFLLAGVFVFLSFKSRRHFPLMVVASFYFVLESGIAIFGLKLKDKIIKMDNFKRQKFIVAAFLERGLKFFILLALVLASVSLFLQINFTRQPFAAYCGRYPCGATVFLRAHPEYQNLRIFNQYNWGGYLIHELPGRLLFIDGRLPQVIYLGHSFLEEYDEFFKSLDMSAAKLNEHRIGLVLMSSQDKALVARKWEKIMFGISEAELQPRNSLRDYLNSSPDWRLEYSDTTAALYLRKSLLP